MCKVKGFTLLEVTMAMIIMSIIIVCTIPLMTIRKSFLGTERYTHACVKSNNVNSTECNTFVNLCKSSSTNNSCKNMITYAMLGYAPAETATQQTFAKQVLVKACTEGAGVACDFFINRCITDETKCDEEFHTFLTKDNTDTSLGSLYMEKAVRNYYNNGIANIKSEVEDDCGNCMAGKVACIIRGYGTGSCTCGSAAGDTMPDGTKKVGFITTDVANGYGYNLCTTSYDQASKTWNNGTANYVTTGATSVIDGLLNTNTLLNLNATVSANYDAMPHYAALACQGVTEGGHTDWYLPSTSELTLMNTFRSQIDNFDTTAGYWSSTEDSSNSNAIYYDFNAGGLDTAPKNTIYKIRCVRRDY